MNDKEAVTMFRSLLKKKENCNNVGFIFNNRKVCY